jgi:hypothetical protein
MIVEAIFAIGKLLGGAGFGTIFGGLMGWLNRKVDLEEKRLQWKHELDMRDKDAAIMREEFAGRMKVAQIEGEARVEAEGYKAMAESYKFAVPEEGSKMAAFSAFVRPFLSISYFVVSSIGCGWVVYYAFKVVGVTFSPEQWFDIVVFVLSWFLFMAGAAVGWWYANRPSGRAPAFPLKVK